MFDEVQLDLFFHLLMSKWEGNATLEKCSEKAQVYRTEDYSSFGRNLCVTLFQHLDVISRRTLDSVGWASIWFILTSIEQQGFACFNKFLTITTDDLCGLHQIESKKKKKS